MFGRILALLALVMSLPALAQEGGADAESTLAGSWALQVGPATIFRFDMAPVPGKPGEWKGSWSRPQSFATDGNHFSQMKLPAKVLPSMAGLEFDGAVELSFNDPRPGAIPDIFRFKLIDADAAEMIYVGTSLAPYMVYRVKSGTPLGPFEAGAVYARPVPKGSEESGAAEGPPDASPPVEDSEFSLPPRDSASR